MLAIFKSCKELNRGLDTNLHVSRQAIVTRQAGNKNYVISAIRNYVKKNWRGKFVIGLSVSAFTAGLIGCPLNKANDKKPTTQITADGGIMSEGGQAAVKKPEKKEYPTTLTKEELEKLIPKRSEEKKDIQLPSEPQPASIKSKLKDVGYW